MLKGVLLAIVVIANFTTIRLFAMDLSCNELDSTSFSDVLNRALLLNPQIKKSENAIKISNYDLMRARSPFYPRLDFVSKSEKIKADGNIPGLEALLLQGQDSVYHSASSINLELNLYNGGADLANLALAREKIHENRLKLQIEKQKIAMTTLSDYHYFLQSGYDLAIAELQFEISNFKFQYAKKQFSLKQISSLSLSEIELENLQDKLTRKSKERNFINAKDQLFRHFCIVDAATNTDLSTLKNILPNYVDILMDEGFIPDKIVNKVKITESKIQQSTLEASHSKSRNYPKITFFWNTNFAAISDSSFNNSFEDQRRDKTYMGIRLTWNLFDGFGSYAEIKAKKQAIVSAQLDRDIAILEQQNEIVELGQPIGEKREELVIAKSKLEILLNKIRAFEINYKNGSTTKLELSEVKMKLKIQQIEINKLLEDIGYYESKQLLSVENLKNYEK